MRRWLVAIALVGGLARPAAAQPAATTRSAAPAASAAPATDDARFAPTVCLTAVEVRGNRVTAERLIRRALRLGVGDCLRTDDARVRTARYKVLALGSFRAVELRFEKGARRGEVVLVVDVVERETLVLNRIFLGTSLITPGWVGLDAGDRNVFGLGLGASAAFVLAGQGDAEGASAQQAFALRLDDPALGGGALGWRAALHHVAASEPFRVRGGFDDGAAENFAAFDYRRTGGRGGLAWAVTPLTRLSLDLRYEAVRAELPDAPVRELPTGGTVPVDLLLEDGKSRVATIALGLERDTRPDPVLPYAGDHLALYAEAGVEPLSSYGFATLLARYERWWQVAERQVISTHLTAAAVLGDAPRFDRLYVGDLNRLQSPRALGLVVSSTPAFDAFDTGADEVTYGEVGGVAEVQWAYRLFRGRYRLHGGDLFVGAGVWSLGALDRLDEEGGAAVALDVLVDVGLRLDTEIGIFELSLSNALGRVPL